jgi:protein O-mannosyl-transferase
MSSECHLELARVLAKQSQMEPTIAETRRAVELGPENSDAYDLWFTSLRQEGRNAEAIEVARDALSISPFNAELHYRFGLTAGQEGDLVTSATQFAYAMLLRPDRSEPDSKFHLVLLLMAQTTDAAKQLEQAAATVPDSPKALDGMAWLFATHPQAALRHGPEAVRLASRACALTNRKKAAFVATLAAAYAETGRFPDAIRTAEEAISRAEISGDGEIAVKSQRLLASFKAGQLYREEPR